MCVKWKIVRKKSFADKQLQNAHTHAGEKFHEVHTTARSPSNMNPFVKTWHARWRQLWSNKQPRQRGEKKRNDENYSKGAVILDVFNIEWKKLKKKNCVHTPLIHTREVSFGTVRYTTQATMQAKKGNKMLKENYSVTDSRFLFVECFNRSWSSLSNVPVVFLTCSCSVQWNFQGAPSVLWFSFFFFSSFFFYSIFEKTKRFCFFFPQIVFRGERKSSFLAIFFPSKEKNLFRVWTKRDNENIFTIVYQSIFFELKKHFCLQLCGKINCETKFNESFWCGLPIFLQFHSSHEWSWKKFSQHISQKTSSEKIDWKILESERKHAIKFN